MQRLVCALVALSIVLSHTAARCEPLVDTSREIETLSTEFGMCDGPAWNGSGMLYVPDVKGGQLFAWRPAQNRMQVVLPDAGRISAAYFTLGRLYLADNGNSRVARLEGNRLLPLAGHDPQAKPPLRPNDLVVDTQGGIYYTLTQAGQVMYVPPGGEPVVALAGIDTPNGLTLSPDGRTLYVASFVPKQIWACRLEAPGAAGTPRLFATMDDGPERGADGMTIDRAGNVYCAGAQHVWIWNPAGQLVEKIATPTRPINCTFGDSDMHSLYIAGLGGLYRQRMHITGIPPQPPWRSTDGPQPQPPQLSTLVPTEVTPHFDVEYTRHGDRPMLADVFVPAGKSGPFPAVVVVHGGGWMNGDKSKFRALAVALAERGYVTAAIEYRLAGEARFPAAIHDCHAAVRFLRSEARRFQIDPERIGAVGGSAGAHLVGLMAAAPHVAALSGLDSSVNRPGTAAPPSTQLQAAVVMAGPMELATGEFARRAREGRGGGFAPVFFGKTLDEDPALYELASPYTHFSAATPPMLFATGELDRPERDHGALARLRELGVEAQQRIYSGGKHGCWMQHPWFDQMLDDIDAFLARHLR